MSPSFETRSATAADAAAVSALVQASFDSFVAPDWEPAARQHFHAESSVERFTQLIPQAAFAALACRDGQPVGFILLVEPSVLSFLFVDARHLRQGIGAALWAAARTQLRAQHPALRTVELNASPYAVAAYRALGFFPISAPFRRGGSVATRMACWLPGLELPLAFELRPCSAADLELTYTITEQAMRGCFEQTWGPWLQDEQRDKHRESFTPETHRLVLVGDQVAGLVAVEEGEGENGEGAALWLVKLYLKRAFRSRGLGSALLAQVIGEAAARGQGVRLRVLRVNTGARRLYERHGFRVVQETAERFFMAREAP